MQRNLYGVSVLVLGAVLSGPVCAGGYFGAGAGQASSDLCGEAFSLGVTSCDDEDTGYKVFGGFSVNENFAVEGGYLNFGDLQLSGPKGSATIELTALAIDGVAVIPLGTQFSIFGKLGIAFWDADASISGFGSISDDGTDLTFGAGAEFDVTNNFGLRGEWERVDFDGDDVDLLSVSAVIRF